MQQLELHTIYNPNRLLNMVMQRLGLHDDGALSRRLKVARKIIKDIRSGRLPVAASILLVMQEATGISVDELRMLMGDRRARIRLSYAIRPMDTQGVS